MSKNLTNHILVVYLEEKQRIQFYIKFG